MISIIKFTNGHNSVKIYVELRDLFSAHCLVISYICSIFRENISIGFGVIKRTKTNDG